jgi:hypothetical protein
VSLLWIVVVVLLAIVVVGTIVDIVRGHYGAWPTVGWVALVVVLPFVGSAVYWLLRKPRRGDAEEQYLAEADMRRSAGRRLFDSTHMGP